MDVLIIGAGAAGLAAFQELHRAGLDVCCVEARDRIGGRILTAHEPLAPVPIELGAEFIHGRPPEIWELIRSAGLTAYDCGEKAVHIERGEPQENADTWELVDHVMQDMQEAAAKRKDRTFLDFIEHSSHSEPAKQLAVSYVEGFNAAHKEVIGIASLAEDARASDAIQGDRSFRIMNGYDHIPAALLTGIDALETRLRLSAVVEKIAWRSGSATVHVRSALTGATETIRCKRVVVTVPLGVLQAQPGAEGAIRFDPEPAGLLEAARKFRFGHVIRLVLRFRKSFWEDNPDLADTGFLFSQQEFFPTWWTSLPVRAPVLTGWSAGPHADRLLGETRAGVLAKALGDLARITNLSSGKLSGFLEAAWFHDWHADPFSRGAYSYVPAGALPARKILAQPLAGTLYFAGEVTEQKGHSATVHGAIASGKRVARQILESVKRNS